MAHASSQFAIIAAVILSLVSPTLQMTQYTNDPSSCDIIGDGDVYGIGVRLGYYFSWISGLIAVFFDSPKAVRDTRRGVILISLAVFIIIVRNTLNGSFALLEWSIVFPMAIWAPLLVLFFASIMNQDNAPGAISLITVMGSVLVAHPWVWFTRTQQGRRPECEVKGFIFVYFDFYNRHFQSFVKFLAVFYCICGCGIMVWAIISILLYIAKGRKGNDGRETPAAGNNQINISQMQMQHILSSPEGDTTNMMETLMKIWPVRATMMLQKFSLAAVGASTIVFAEKILAGNNIDLSNAPLLSSGQLIPFIVGLAGLVSTIWSVTIGERLAHAHKKRRERAVPLNEIMTESMINDWLGREDQV